MIDLDPGATYVRQESEVSLTAWKLELLYPEENNQPIYLTLGISNLATSMLVVIVFILLSMVLIRLLTDELAGIRRLLLQVKAGSSIEVIPSRLKEASEILPVIGDIAADLQRTNARLADMSLVDELTQLPNRRRFNMEIERALQLAKRGTGACLLLLDLDRFKQINDNRGHASGDRLLRTVAMALHAVLRGTDLAARIGGDEFAVVFINMERTHITHWMQRLTIQLRQLLDAEPTLADAAVVCTISAGAAFAKPTDDFASLFARADCALYQAKNAGRDRLEIAADS